MADILLCVKHPSVNYILIHFTLNKMILSKHNKYTLSLTVILFNFIGLAQAEVNALAKHSTLLT